MSKVDIRPILIAHFRTLRDNRFGDRPALGDIALFAFIPCGFGIALVCLRFGFRGDAVNGFLNAFAILTGLLLNLLVLIFTLATTVAPATVDLRKRKTFLTEIFANVCYSLVIAIAVVCTSVVALGYMRSNQGASTGPIATFLLAALTSNFVLTMLMVIKRMYLLLGKELDRSGIKKAA